MLEKSASLDWLETTVALMAVSRGPESEDLPAGTHVVESGPEGVVAFRDIDEAVRVSRELSRRGAGCGVVIGRPGEALTSRAKTVAQHAIPGQILMTLAVQDLVRDQVEGLTFTEMGNYDIYGRTERLFSLGLSEPTSERHAFLPSRESSFVGRREELDTLRKALDLSRLITVHGQPGIGKSALIRRCMAEMDDGSSEILLVDLSSVRQSELALPFILRMMEVPKLPGEDIIEALVGGLRRRDALLVFDNCQQVLAPIRKLCARLSAECPQLAILIGSQKALRLSGELRMQLTGMECPAPGEPWQAVREYDAPALYEEYARQFDSNFSINEQNAADVAVLCRRLDGLPLAIELAAAKAHILSPKQIVRRLEDRFLLLKGNHSPMSLKQAIEWAHELLSPSSRTLLRRLSIFSGAFSIEWAIEVCVDDPTNDAFEAFEAFEELVDGSLMNASNIASSEKLFFLTESIRAFGKEKLAEADELRDLQKRHAQWCISLSHEASEGLRGTAQLTWLATMDAVFPDIRQVITRETLPRADGALAAELLLACYPFLWERNYFAEGLYLAEKVVNCATATLSKDYSRVLNLAGAFASYLGDQHSARKYSLLSVRRARREGSGRQEAAGWSGVAMSYHQLGRYSSALSCYRRAHRAFEAIGDVQSQFIALTNRSACEMELGMIEEAEESLAAARPLVDQATESDRTAYYQNLSHLEIVQGHYHPAFEAAEKAVKSGRELAGVDTIAKAARNCAYALAGMERHHDSAVWVGFAKSMQRKAEAEIPEHHARRLEELEEWLRTILGHQPYEIAQGEGLMVELEDVGSLFTN